jgi:hypothetical protein
MCYTDPASHHRSTDMDLAELGQLADDLEAARAERIEADKRAAELKSRETQLKTTLIAEMEANNLSSVGGKSCVINRITKQRAFAQDWPTIYEYIHKNDAFDLLHRRLTDSAVMLRKDDGIDVPGVGIMDYSHITFAKART